MNGYCYSGSCSGAGMRNFLTKEEKIDLLKEYKQRLDLESKGVTERIAELREAKSDDEDSE